MISALAEGVARRLLAAGWIAEDEGELYAYGFFLLLSRVFFLAVTLAFGLVAGVAPESLLFYGMFSLLRCYAGGIHAGTERACTLLTTLAMGASVLVIRLLEATRSGAAVLALLAAGGISVVLLSPLDSPGKLLDAQDSRRYRAVSLALSLAVTLLGVGAALAGLWGAAGAAAVSAALEGILLAAGKLSAYRRQKSAI